MQRHGARWQKNKIKVVFTIILHICLPPFREKKLSIAGGNVCIVLQQINGLIFILFSTIIECNFFSVCAVVWIWMSGNKQTFLLFQSVRKAFCSFYLHKYLIRLRLLFITLKCWWFTGGWAAWAARSHQKVVRKWIFNLRHWVESDHKASAKLNTSFCCSDSSFPLSALSPAAAGD